MLYTNRLYVANSLTPDERCSNDHRSHYSHYYYYRYRSCGCLNMVAQWTSVSLSQPDEKCRVYTAPKAVLSRTSKCSWSTALSISGCKYAPPGIVGFPTLSKRPNSIRYRPWSAANAFRNPALWALKPTNTTTLIYQSRSYLDCFFMSAWWRATSDYSYLLLPPLRTVLFRWQC